MHKKQELIMAKRPRRKHSSAFKAKVVLTVIKYERVYLHAYEPTSEVKSKIG
jgi:hypothetical protein